jgi:hypothetical protein
MWWNDDSQIPSVIYVALTLSAAAAIVASVIAVAMSLFA